MKVSVFSLLAAAEAALAWSAEPSFVTSRPPSSTIEPSAAAISSAQATAVVSSPTSNVKGVGFDRIVQIWLENTDFNVASADGNMQWLASQGILLTNYFATTHPSQPNYVAAVAGDNFGMENDEFISFPPNISTVVDLLDTKGITWGEYQEHLPYAGFEGFNFSNQKTFANDYVRKHNPLIMFENVAKNATRAAQIKNFTSFTDDLTNQKLPQWSFITPNMSNDAHDTNITFAASWTRKFVEPLLNNSYFMNNTLLIVSFDECEDYPSPNRIYTVLLGGAIDKSLRGTKDDTFYSHYSTISTVSVNWGLPSLGRWDCDANVLSLVANKTGYKNTAIKLDGLYFNMSYPGVVSNKKYTPGWYPAPATNAKCAAGLGVLPSITSLWGNSSGTYNYTSVYVNDMNAGINTANGVPPRGVNDAGAPPPPAPSKPSGAGVMGRPGVLVWLGVVGLAAAML